MRGLLSLPKISCCFILQNSLQCRVLSVSLPGCYSTLSYALCTISIWLVKPACEAWQNRLANLVQLQEQTPMIKSFLNTSPIGQLELKLRVHKQVRTIIRCWFYLDCLILTTMVISVTKHNFIKSKKKRLQILAFPTSYQLQFTIILLFHCNYTHVLNFITMGSWKVGVIQ